MKERVKPAERAWIESLRKQVADSPKAKRGGLDTGIGDDCAILRPPSGHQIVVTTDFSLESVHFRREWHPPESVGHRCLTRGLSDIAAMGGQPLAAFLSFALPAELMRNRRGQLSWRERFLAGFLALADRYRVPLAGGDTARSPLQKGPPASAGSSRISGFAVADIVLVGSVPRNRALLRSGAKPGDRIYVTGHLAGAAAELALLASSPRRFRACTHDSVDSPNLHPHLFPEPRIAVGKWLLNNRRATAAIDISDGLSTDLDHLCEESGVAAVVDASALPLHPLALARSGAVSAKSLQLALNGGEDYELLFTASPHTKIPTRITDVPITCIGRLRRQVPRQPRMVLVAGKDGDREERPLLAAGWEH